MPVLIYTPGWIEASRVTVKEGVLHKNTKTLPPGGTTDIKGIGVPYLSYLIGVRKSGLMVPLGMFGLNRSRAGVSAIAFSILS